MHSMCAQSCIHLRRARARCGRLVQQVRANQYEAITTKQEGRVIEYGCVRSTVCIPNMLQQPFVPHDCRVEWRGASGFLGVRVACPSQPHKGCRISKHKLSCQPYYSNSLHGRKAASALSSRALACHTSCHRTRTYTPYVHWRQTWFQIACMKLN